MNIGKSSLLLIFLWSGAVSAQQYQANWNSIDSRPIPQWYNDAKFGIFIHWGVYSVPSWAPTENVGVYGKYAEWYWYRLKEKSDSSNPFWVFHQKTYGSRVRYQDFAKDFTAAMFDPDQWAELFKQAGAKYVVLTSKHHDGFCLWPSAQSWNWNSMDIGPHQDLAGALTNAVRKKGLHMGFYYSLYEWFNPLYHKNVSQYVDQHMIPQMKDLVTRYKPDILWTDGEWEHTSDVWKSTQFLAWLYNESPVKKNVVVNDRWGSETRSAHGGFYTAEYNYVSGNKERGDSVSHHKWEECQAIGGSFGYNRHETLKDYSTSGQLIATLVRTVSNGGNLLLDIGPTADGRIPVIMQQRLMAMGNWLKVNGDAIYSSRPWWNNPNKRDSSQLYTIRGKNLYLICLQWPSKEIQVRGLTSNENPSVTLLGLDKKVNARYHNGVLLIDIPKVTPGMIAAPYAFVFKITNAFQ